MAYFRISLKDIWKTSSVLKIWQLFLLLFIYFWISGFSILSRKYLLYSLSAPVKVKNLFYIHFSTMAAHYSTPAKLGFPLAVYLLKKFDDVSYATGSAMIIIELIVSIGICGILALAGAFFYFGEKTNILALSFLCLFLLGLLGWYGIRMYLLRGNKKRRPYKFTSQIQEAFSRISVSHVIMYTFLVLLGQLLAGITLVLLAVFLSEKLSLFQAIVVNSTAYFLGAISMIPMGLGTREASMLFYLGHLGISHEIGISIVAIQRLFSTGLSFLLGVIFGSIMGLKNGQRPPAKQKMTS